VTLGKVKRQRCSRLSLEVAKKRTAKYSAAAPFGAILANADD